ncbi:MAG: sadH [Tardiphaga sp.]|nr:sadH [Tardiphaga sp.]MDB5574670.1 sadH [Tardiphaga sp.]
MAMELKGETAVITGAASGIGRAVAISLAKRGCNVALVDLNPAGLEETASQLFPYNIQATLHVADIGDAQAIAALPDAIMTRHGRVDWLVNNAGVALGGQFEDISSENFEWLFNINFWGVVRMTRAFLPMLRAAPAARIVNLSSIFGIIAPPEQSAYVASKFAVRGFSQSLRHELANTKISVTVVHPGGVATSIADNARGPAHRTDDEIAQGRIEMKRLLTMPPAQAGEIIVIAALARKGRVMVGSDATFAAFVERLFPVSYWSKLQRLRGR